MNFIVGAKRGAERAENRVERSGERELQKNDRAERSGAEGGAGGRGARTERGSRSCRNRLERFFAAHAPLTCSACFIGWAPHESTVDTEVCCVSLLSNRPRHGGALPRGPRGPWPLQDFGWGVHNAFGPSNNLSVHSLVLAP